MSDLHMPMPLKFEPLRKNRWVVRFPSDLGISEWMLSAASRPSINQKSTEIEFFNTSTFVVGPYCSFCFTSFNGMDTSLFRICNR